jgi:hypothetical protein
MLAAWHNADAAGIPKHRQPRGPTACRRISGSVQSELADAPLFCHDRRPGLPFLASTPLSEA